jgi:hypothetical protein
MTYFGTPVAPTTTGTSGDTAAKLADLQIQINNKANKTGAVLTTATISATPAVNDNSLAVADTQYVDRAAKLAAPDFLLMAAHII